MKLALFCALGAIGFPQAPPKLAFEVVSIKPVPKGNNIELMRSGRAHWNVDDARVDLGALEMANILAEAFPGDRTEVPDWALDTRFDINAKIPASGNRKQVPQMLLTMEGLQAAMRCRDALELPISENAAT